MSVTLTLIKTSSTTELIGSLEIQKAGFTKCLCNVQNLLV